MADTQRSKSALATLFADNIVGAISPQDLRDFLETMHPPFGSLYISTSGETSIADSNWTKVAGTTTDVSLHRFSGTTALSVNNRLRYDGNPDVHVHAVISFSSQIATGTNKTLEFGAYLYDDSAASGSVLAHSVVTRFASSTAVGTGALHFDATLSNNDYVEFHVRNTTDTTNITMVNAYVFLMGMMV
jgi:hypothetical protein